MGTGDLKNSRHTIPLAAKIGLSAFAAVLVPVYLHTYGPTNFLWFCDAALLLTVAGVWSESLLLISMCAVGILVPQFLWLLDFVINLFGANFLNLTAYMFDKNLSLFIRGLSLFHGWLPLLLVWLLSRLGYDRRALAAWSVVAVGLVFGGYFLGAPAGSHPADPNLPININEVYGFNDKKPQTWMNENLYVVLWLGALFVGAYLPTHLAVRKTFAPARRAAAR